MDRNLPAQTKKELCGELSGRDTFPRKCDGTSKVRHYKGCGGSSRRRQTTFAGGTP